MKKLSPASELTARTISSDEVFKSSPVVRMIQSLDIQLEAKKVKNKESGKRSIAPSSTF
jgi:hypothetical protein